MGHNPSNHSSEHDQMFEENHYRTVEIYTLMFGSSPPDDIWNVFDYREVDNCFIHLNLYKYLMNRIASNELFEDSLDLQIQRNYVGSKCGISTISNYNIEYLRRPMHPYSIERFEKYAKKLINVYDFEKDSVPILHNLYDYGGPLFKLQDSSNLTNFGPSWSLFDTFG